MYQALITIIKSFSFSFIFLLINMSYADSGIAVTDAWTRPSHTKTSATYITINNSTNEEYVLVNVKSPGTASIVELHKTVIENNVSQMVPINRLVIPAKSQVVMKPKGLHIMLIGLKRELVNGDVVPIILEFENNKQIKVSTIVQ